MKNKKGFTLIELLATIAILGIIIAIAVFSFVNIRESVNEKEYQSLASTIKTAAKGYAEDTGISKMFVQTLIDEGLLEVDDETKILHDPRNNSSLNCQVVTFDGDNVTISEEENPTCDISILNDVAIKIQYTNDRGEKEDVKDGVWFNKAITLSVASTGAVPIDLTKATYSWLSPLAPDTTYTRETLTIDNDFVDDMYQVVVSIDDKKYRAYAQVKIDKTEPRSFNLVDKNPTDWTPNKNIEFELSDTGSGIDSWQLSFDRYTEPTSWNKIANPGSKSEKINTTVNLSGLREGESVYIWVKDVVGNKNKSQLSSASGESGLRVNTIDGEVDRVALTGNPASGTYANKITLTGTLQDSKSGISSYVCTKSASAPASGWVNVTRTNAEIKVNCPDNLVDANTDYYIHAKDYVGNVKSAKYTVSNFDNKIDLYDVQDITNTGYREQTTLRGTATDNGSGIVAYAFTTSTATPGSWTTVSKRNYLDVTSVLKDNTTYYFHVKDNAGNTAYKQVTVSNIVVPKEYKDHLTSTTNSYITKNYNLSGAVQIIRVDTNTGNANGGLHGTTTTVTVSNGYTYTQTNPATCPEEAKVTKANSNCSEYECPENMWTATPTSDGMCTNRTNYYMNMDIHPATGPDSPPRNHKCVNGKWKCTTVTTYTIDGTHYCSEEWFFTDDLVPPNYQLLSTSNCSGPGTCNVATQNCFEYEACSPNGTTWNPTWDVQCSTYQVWQGDFLATCKTAETLSCPNSNQKLVGRSCYSCTRGTLNANNSCDYDCTTTSSYWEYDITIHYYVIK